MTEGNGTAAEPARGRRVQILMEVTQALIGLSVTGTTLYVAARLAFIESGTSAQLLLSNAFFLVIGYYFGRQQQRVDHRRTDEQQPQIPP